MNLIVTREGEWLVTSIEALNRECQAKSIELQEPLRAGSHPHLVRQRLLALAVFPDKWINRLFSVGGIQVEGEAIRLHAFAPANLLKDATYAMAKLPASAVKPGAGMLEPVVLYENDWCLVMDKPSGMPVHPNAPGHRGTLDEAVARYMLAQGDPQPVKHIHRLDDDTAGPVLYAKNEPAQLLLDEAMRHKQIDRRYEAIVHGRLGNRAGTIDAPIGKDRHHKSRRRVSPSGDAAKTHFELMESYAHASRVRLTLETGRTHQIRVHMSHIGHPLVGDTLYGGNDKDLKHQALRGVSLSFTPPFAQDPIQVEASEPSWFAQLREKLSRN
ncbi:23S rRNA pseudouridine1911/1915/1917 synthase [Paenibacillus phyllosphaerae]|uniref:Pseudouridine synthase n=1 Tax=Paenibacillus phyllosphaerae TaxID=274593 RepID=A0A7W5FMD8_9BACL|nr:RluA family pseudouridine synthase [Paenibacillus phyllosphaerae]MBB3109889.1 23S rRNA pseudouridine1911/1915/1917 synthase [Paenibacillus phyllosphaerae]